MFKNWFNRISERQYKYVGNQLLEGLDGYNSFSDMQVSLEKVFDILHRCKRNEADNSSCKEEK